MKQFIYLLVFCLFVFSNLNAQNNDYYYYYKGEKIDLALDKKRFNLFIEDTIGNEVIVNLGIETNEIQNANFLGQSVSKSLIEYTTEPSELEFKQNLSLLLSQNEVRNFSLYFELSNGISVGTSTLFYIKLRDEDDFNLLQQIAVEKNATILQQNEFMPLWYKLFVNPNSLKSSIELANEFYETGYFEEVDPAFILDYTANCSTNDLYINELWGLDDINACNAWSVTEGAGVKVAVLDEGIYKQHNDLNDNISTLSFDTRAIGPNPPSEYQSGRNHGMHIAGIIAAEKNNNLQVAGVAPQCEIMSVSNNYMFETNSSLSEELANGMNWAWVNGAEIINCSWGSSNNSLNSALLEDAIINTLTYGRNGLGTVLIFATGNGDQEVRYPANFHPDILTVGALAQNSTRWANSDFGPELDVVAPGYNILSTIGPQNIEYLSGTSMAAPHVSGIAALILSINPCLDVRQVMEIIESTASKAGNYTYTTHPNRPHGTWNEEMGYGKVNAYAAVQLASTFNTSNLNLSMRDRLNDTGFDAGYPWTWDIDESPDIWVRNTDDGLVNKVHQDPIYEDNPNYVYVRVTNKSCDPSNGDGELGLYWTQASSNSSWPSNWDGSMPALGNLIGTQSIPNINPGESVILTFEWNVWNPAVYGNWNSCLLSRIENSMEDPITVYPNDLGQDVYQNNNISARNTEVITTTIDEPPVIEGVLYPHGTYVLVGNVSSVTENHDLIFLVPDNETEEPITTMAEVTLTFDSIGWGIFLPHFQNREDIRILSDNRVQLLQPRVEFNDIIFNSELRIPIYIGFAFLVEEVTTKNEFKFHVVQKKSTEHPIFGDHWSGGVHFTIRKEPRDPFEANAGGDESILGGESITLSATDISEAAEYRWFDSNGNLIHVGQNLIISPDITKKYKLEVIALADGFKDSDQVEVEVNNNKIVSISPNPATNDVQIDYIVENDESAYLMVMNVNNYNSSNNYILDCEQTQTIIDVSNLTSGSYTVTLVVNGVFVDTKNLVIIN